MCRRWDSASLEPVVASLLLKNLSVFNIFLHGRKYFPPDPSIGSSPIAQNKTRKNAGINFVPAVGLEPTILAKLVPKTSAYSNSATPAYILTLLAIIVVYRETVNYFKLKYLTRNKYYDIINKIRSLTNNYFLRRLS